MNKIIVTTILTSSIILAATPPTSGDILRQVEPQTLQKGLKEIPSLKKKKFKVPIVDEKGVKIFVKDFTIKGNNTYSNETLLSLLDEFKNTKLTINQIKQAASVITKYYRDNGYFVARAYVPAQELNQKNAIVEIIVIEGVYGKSIIDNSSLIDDSIAQAYMDELFEDSNVISISSLERQLLLMDELKGVEVTNTQIVPGTKVGQSDFIVTLEDEPRYNGYVIADNYGSRYTGRYRVNVLGFVNSLNKRGDSLGISTLLSNTTDLKNARLSYDIPIGYDGLALNSSISKTKYEIGKEFESQNIHGDSWNFNTGISYPIIKQRVHTLDVSLNYAYNDITDNDNSQHKKKELNTVTLSLDDTLKTSFFNKAGILNSSISFTKGNLALNSNDARISDNVLNSEGDYEKINFSISQIQVLSPKVSVLLSLKAQKSFDKNLDGIEDIAIGGAWGARAYGSSEASGDNGYLTSLEFFYQLPNYKAGAHNISTFLDHGKVWFDENKITSLNDRVLNSIGLGYNLNYENFSLKATYAYGFGKDKTPTSDGDDTSLNRFYSQVVYRF